VGGEAGLAAESKGVGFVGIEGLKNPVSESLVNEGISFRVKLGGAFGGLAFPSAHDREVAVSGDKFSSLLERAERQAGLAKLKGGLWHPMRRAWAIDVIFPPNG
jgi:hypothetical protein